MDTSEINYARRRTVGKRISKVNYEDIAIAIYQVQPNVADEFAVLHADQWELIRQTLRWPNGNKSIKNLKQIWRANRGNIQNRVAELKHEHTNIQQDPETWDTVKRGPTLRKVKKLKRYSSNWETSCVKKTKYCICRSVWTKTETKPMLQCSSCAEWYHLQCIGLADNLANFGRFIDFACGLENCQSNFKISAKKDTIRIPWLDSSKPFPKLQTSSTQVFSEQSHITPSKLRIYNTDFDMPSECVNSKCITQPITQTAASNKDNNNQPIGDDTFKEESDDALSKSAVFPCSAVNDLPNPISAPRSCLQPTIFEDASTLQPFFQNRENHSENNTSTKITTPSLTASKAIPYYSTVFNEQPSRQTAELSTRIETKLGQPLPTIPRNTPDGTDNSDTDPLVELPEKIIPNDTQSRPVADKTLSAAIGCDIPEDNFVKTLPETAKFQINPAEWQKLKYKQTGRQFQRGKWEPMFISGIKDSNPYCVFCFKYHRVSSASNRQRRVGSRIFYAKAYCKFKDCPVEVEVSMFQKKWAEVTYSGGNINHDIGEHNARNIAGDTREKIRDTLVHVRPHNLYKQKMYNTLPEALVAGNCDAFGKSRNVFRKIASEALHTNQKDPDDMESLRKIAEEMRSRTPDRTIPGFIQIIMMQPSAVMYWTEAGIRLWHDLAKRDVVFWDATGGIVRKTGSGRKFLYYELTCRHPKKGESSIPVSAMITTSQSQPMVRYWLSEFRRAEKQLYGHGNITRPLQINSDRSVVFLTVAVEEFCGESLSEYIKRAWKIITGKAVDKDLSQTVVHACASHVMNDFKKLCLKHYKSQFQFGMYCGSLLLNAGNITQMKDIFRAFSFVLLSRYISPQMTEYSAYLINEIDKLSSATPTFQTPDVNTGELSYPLETVNPNTYTEEEFLVQSVDSPFATLGKTIFDDCEKQIQRDQSKRIVTTMNRRYCPALLQDILKRLIPTIPLWSNLLLGDLKRHGCSSAYSNNLNSPPCVDTFRSTKDISRNTTAVEERFHVLKNITFSGRSNFRVDEFSVDLEKETLSSQTMACLTILRKAPRKRKKAVETMEETWNRSKPAPNLKNKSVGKYQQPPQKRIQVIPDTKSPTGVTLTDADVFLADNPTIGGLAVLKKLPQRLQRIYQQYATDLMDRKNKSAEMKTSALPLFNVGNSCWLNACLQALSGTDFVTRLLDSDMTLDENSGYLPLYNIWAKMTQQEEIFTEDLEKATQAMSQQPFGFQPQQQHDVHEAIISIMGRITDIIDCRLLEVEDQTMCLACNGTSSLRRQKNIDVALVVPLLKDAPGDVQVQSLLEDHFCDESVSDAKCDQCDTLGEIMRTSRVVGVPDTLILTLKRYCLNEVGRVEKIARRVGINGILGLDTFSGHSPPQRHWYELCNVINHHGQTPRAGHYTVSRKKGLMVIEIDDSTVSFGDISHAENNGYIFIYNRRDDPLYPKCMRCVFSCLPLALGFQSLAKLLCSSMFPLKSTQKSALCEAIMSRRDENKMFQDTSDVVITSQICPPGNNGVSEFLNWLISRYLGKTVGTKLQTMFGITTLRMKSCSQCSPTEIEYHNEIAPRYHKVSYRISQSTPQYTIKCKQCGQDTTKSSAISSFGETIFLHCKPDDILRLIQKKLNIRQPYRMYPYIEAIEFALVSFIIYGDEEIVVHCKENNFQVFGRSKTTLGLEVYEMDWKSALKEKDIIAVLNKVGCRKEVLCNTVAPNKVSDVLPGGLLPQRKISDHQAALARCFRGVLVSPVGSLEEQDVKSLLNGWLNDKHIDIYLNYLMKKGKRGRNVHVVPACWFGARMLNNTIDEKQSSTVDWLKHDVVLLPVNTGNHWIIYIIVPQKRQVIYIDSLAQERKNITSRLLQYLCFEEFTSVNSVESSKWNVVNLSKASNFPRQTDATNCGVYLCIFSKCYVEQFTSPDIFSSDNLKQFRRFIMVELFREYLPRLEFTDIQTIRLTFKDLLEDTTIASFASDMISSRVPCTRHNDFLQDAFAMKEKLLLGFAKNFINDVFKEELNTFLRFLFKNTYAVDPSKPYTSTICIIGTDVRTPLNSLCKTNTTLADIYIMEVLSKEVTINMLHNKCGKPRSELDRLCCETEFSARPRKTHI